MKIKRFVAVSLFLLLIAHVQGQVPGIINYQGRIVVSGTNFDGIGLFKFALMDGGGGQTLWSNGVGTVAVPVTKGLYAVLLGDSDMNPLSGDIFTYSNVQLRVWFDDGVSGLQQLSPDQRIAAVGYALMAGGVSTGAVTTAMLADGAVTGSKLAAGAVTGVQLSSNLTVSGTLTAGSFQGNGVGLSNVPGTVLWKTVAGTSQQAAPNTGYILTNAAQTIVTLPTIASVGDVVQVSGVGTGGWQVIGLPGGVTWTACESNRYWISVASSADGTKLVAAENGGQLYTSADSGATWIARDSNRQWYGVASSADGTKLVAIVIDGQIYTSTNSGATWTARNSSRQWHAVASSGDGTKLVAVVYGGQIYTSTDSGATWTPRSSSTGWHAVASSADGTKLVAAVAGGGSLFTSTDSGATWVSCGIFKSWSCVASSADGTKLVAVTESGNYIYTSTNSGATWTQRESGRNWSGVASSTDGTRLVAVVNGGQIYTSTDSGVTWTPHESSRGWTKVASSADGSVLVAGVWGGRIYTSKGYIIGAQGTTATLQYFGNGQWQPLNESQIATGAVGSSQLASNLTVSGTFSAAIIQGNGSGLSNINAVTLGGLATNQFLRRDANTDFAGAVLTVGGASALEVKGTLDLKGSFLKTTTTLVPNLNADLLDGLESGAFWKLAGNGGTTPGTHFIGTTDNQAFEIKVNNGRVLRLESNATIGGYSGNTVSGSGATISGGGFNGWENSASSGGTVSGGSGNSATVTGGGGYATIGGGMRNAASADSSTVGGGAFNVASGLRTVVGGGELNSTIGDYSAIGGGQSNTASSSYAFIGGGYNNRASEICTVVAGGWRNIATAGSATVGGGNNNSATEAGATVPGGGSNSAAGIGSFAAGYRAKANHDGTLVWGDVTEADFASTGNNQFLIRASGGVGIGTNAPVSALDVSGSITATGLVINGNAQINGMLKSGSGNGTSELPSPSGLIVRRINSTNSMAGQVVACTDTMTLERDGSNGGYVVRWTASTGNFIIACTGINPSGTQVNFYQYFQNPGSGGIMTVYSDGQAVVYFRCSFGRIESGQHLTELSIGRYVGTGVWCGTVTSTYNQ